MPTTLDWACLWPRPQADSAARGRVQALLQALGAKEEEVEVQPLPDGDGPWLAGQRPNSSFEERGLDALVNLTHALLFRLTSTSLNGAEFDLKRWTPRFPTLCDRMCGRFSMVRT